MHRKSSKRSGNSLVLKGTDINEKELPAIKQNIGDRSVVGRELDIDVYRYRKRYMYIYICR